MIGFSRCLNVNHDLEKDCGRQLNNSLFKASAPDRVAEGVQNFQKKRGPKMYMQLQVSLQL